MKAFTAGSFKNIRKLQHLRCLYGENLLTVTISARQSYVFPKPKGFVNVGKRRISYFSSASSVDNNLKFDVNKSSADSLLPVTEYPYVFLPSAESASLLAPIQSTLIYAHESTGLPWWSTFVLCTLAFRSSLVPLSFLARYEMTKLMSGESLYHTMHLQKLFQKESKTLSKELLLHQKNKNKEGIRSVSHDMLRLTLDRIKGQFAVWKMCKANPSWAIAVPFVQAAGFITYAVAVRNMIATGDLDLTNQGILWFTNLSETDSTYLLPIIAVSASYLSIEHGIRGGLFKSKDEKKVNSTTGSSESDQDKHVSTLTQEKGPGDVSFMNTVGYYIQCLLILSFPFTSQLPSAVYMYWIPSTVFGMSLNSLLRSSFVKKQFKPQPPKPLKRKNMVEL